MSSNELLRGFRALDGDTYGEAHGFDGLTGDFKRDAQGVIRIVDGPEMVAYHLVRCLRTPIGDDPLRPELGLDRRALLERPVTEGGVDIKRAVIDAIGPDAIPWVGRLAPPDIELDFDAGNRIASMTVTATLTDGTPVSFRIGFDALLGAESFETTQK